MRASFEPSQLRGVKFLRTSTWAWWRGQKHNKWKASLTAVRNRQFSFIRLYSCPAQQLIMIYVSHLISSCCFFCVSLSISRSPSLAPAPATRPLSSGAKCAGDFKGPLCQMKSFPVSISEVDCVKSYWSTTQIVLRWLISLFCTLPSRFRSLPLPLLSLARRSH